VIRLAAVLLLLAAACAAHAFPTSSNIIPAADMLAAGDLRVELENDGAPRLLGPDAESYALLQLGATPRLEVGLDFYSVGSDNHHLFNAKWLAWSEAARRPAFAVGTMEVGTGYCRTDYAVATKDVGRGLRLHLGGARCESVNALLLGGELQVGPNDYILADWATWDAGYASLGVYHQLPGGAAVNLAYAWPNDAESSSLVLLNISHTFSLR